MDKEVNNAVYEVGQKVRVIDYESKTNHLFGFGKEMLDKFGGKEVTISYVGHMTKHGKRHASNYPKPCDNFIYHIKEDNDQYYWSNTMFSVI